MAGTRSAPTSRVGRETSSTREHLNRDDSNTSFGEDHESSMYARSLSSSTRSRYEPGTRNSSLSSLDRNNRGDNISDSREFIDNLVSLMGLTTDQAADLVQISKWGRSLELGDLLIRISSHANQFRVENLVSRLVNKENTMAAVIADLQKMLEKKWQMSELQHKTVRTVGKDLIINPKYTDYKRLSARVKQSLEKLPEFEGVFSNPHRLSVLDRETTTTCRHIRNEFRKAIRDTTFGDYRLSLDEAASDLTERFLLGGMLKANADHTVHIAILRRFARENRQILIEDDDEDGAEEDNQISDEEGLSQGGRKRRRQTGRAKSNGKKSGGKVQKGKDWWSQVQSWFAEKKRLWGASTDTAEWKRYISETFEREKSIENSENSIRLLPGPILSSLSVPAFDDDIPQSPTFNQDYSNPGSPVTRSPQLRDIPTHHVSRNNASSSNPRGRSPTASYLSRSPSPDFSERRHAQSMDRDLREPPPPPDVNERPHAHSTDRDRRDLPPPDFSGRPRAHLMDRDRPDLPPQGSMHGFDGSAHAPRILPYGDPNRRLPSIIDFDVPMWTAQQGEMAPRYFPSDNRRDVGSSGYNQGGTTGPNSQRLTGSFSGFMHPPPSMEDRPTY